MERFTEYNAVITRMPDKSGFILSRVWIMPVAKPASDPAIIDISKAVIMGYCCESSAAVTDAPSVKLPSVVISGMLKILSVI